MTARSTPRRSALFVAFIVLVMSVVSGDALSQEEPFRNVVITEAFIGDVAPGRYAFRATVTTVAPGATIPFHVHNYPGIRYMLEGALTIHWKGRGSQTFSAGSSYFEGPGENHPKSGMAAANQLDVPARVLIIELVPAE